MRSWHALGFFGLLAAAPVAGQDRDDPGVQLAWVRGEGAEECPDSAGLEAEVKRRLDRDPFREPITQTIEGVVRRTAGGHFTAELYDRDVSGRLVGARRLTSQGDDCDALASAVVLAVALAIDPDAALRPTEAEEPATHVTSERDAATPTGDDPESRIDDEAASAEAASRRANAASDTPVEPSSVSDTPAAQHPAPEETPEYRPPSVRVKLGAVLSWQLVPGLAPGLALDIDGHVAGPLRFIVGMLYVPEQQTAKPTANFGFGVTAARVGACVMTGGGRLSAGGCASVSLGAMHAVVYRPRPIDPGDRFFGSLDLLAQGSVVLFDPVFLSGAIGVAVPFVRDRFHVEGSDFTEFQQPLVIPIGVISAGLLFP